jgi:hypothetical protein
MKLFFCARLNYRLQRGLDCLILRIKLLRFSRMVELRFLLIIPVNTAHLAVIMPFWLYGIRAKASLSASQTC